MRHLGMYHVRYGIRLHFDTVLPPYALREDWKSLQVNKTFYIKERKKEKKNADQQAAAAGV